MASSTQSLAMVEQEIRDSVTKEVPWDLVTTFLNIVRESGTDGEWKAAHYIYDKLQSFGANVTMHTPELLISVPRGALLEVLSPDAGWRVRAKTPAFSLPTSGVEADVVFLPSPKVERIEDMFSTRGQAAETDIAGKIVISEGMSMPMRVRDHEKRGAVAQIYVNPGEAIHEGICTSIWGTPTLSSLDRKPKSPIVCVNRPDGEKLIEQARAGTLRVRIETKLDEGWVRCPLNTVWIEGTEEPEKFLLVHGHLDSWHEGIGDNATGDASLLELARVFTKHRAKLRRSLRICWWPGHSQGRYAGSTWFADTFARDLAHNCLGQLNIDSPGCRDATEYFEDVMWMREADLFCRDVIRDVTGKDSRGKRPLRAGDYSFNQIGLTGFFMLLSNIPPARRKELGYNYIVGGCGGNTAWHTESDVLDVASPDALFTDINIYVTAITRILNADVLPFRYSRAAREIREQLEKYHEGCQEHLDLSIAIQAAADLEGALERFEAAAAAAGQPQHRQFNQAMLAVARLLVPVNYARGERFDHDPAVSLPALPRLDRAPLLAQLAGDHTMYRSLQTELIRETNKIVDGLDSARAIAERLL
jgi:Peptidase family M28